MFTPVTDSLEWVIEYLPDLSERGFKIFGEEELKRFARPKKMTSSSFRVASGEQWFELEGEMTFGDISLNINDIRKVLIRDKPYIQLQVNTTGELPANWLKELKKLLHLMSISIMERTELLIAITGLKRRSNNVAGSMNIWTDKREIARNG